MYGPFSTDSTGAYVVSTSAYAHYKYVSGHFVLRERKTRRVIIGIRIAL